MIRFSFVLDEIAPELVTEFTAFYRVDGTLRLHTNMGVVFEEAGVPVVELAVWLFHWLGRPTEAYAFLPDGYDHDCGPLLHLAPAEGTRYRLTYGDGAHTDGLTAERADWEAAVAGYLQDLRQALRQRFHLPLDTILHRFKSSA